MDHELKPVFEQEEDLEQFKRQASAPIHVMSIPKHFRDKMQQFVNKFEQQSKLQLLQVYAERTGTSMDRCFKQGNNYVEESDETLGYIEVNGENYQRDLESNDADYDTNIITGRMYREPNEHDRALRTRQLRDHLKRRADREQSSSAFRELRDKLKQLPISQHREQILNTINNNQVVVICGETGSGKTTQVPQM